MKITPAELARATGATFANAEKYAYDLNVAMGRFGITTPRRVSAFLATVAIESTNLTAVEESLYYKDPVRLAKIYPRAFRDAAAATPYARNSAKLGQLLYEGFWGRGLIQLTWEKNYRDAGEALGYDYVSNPSLLLQPKHAAMTAAWFWSVNGCNEAADRNDMDDVTRRVNGPARMHLHERKTQYASNMQWLGGVVA